jgi:hypothetical protein
MKVRIVKHGAQVRDLDVHNLNFLPSTDAYAVSDTTEIDVDFVASLWLQENFTAYQKGEYKPFSKYLEEALNGK